jgi:hypothetical protein
MEVRGQLHAHDLFYPGESVADTHSMGYRVDATTDVDDANSSAVQSVAMPTELSHC